MIPKLGMSLINKWSVIVLLCGILLSLTLSYEVQQSNDQRTNKAVHESLQQTVQSILTRIQLYQYGLRAARGAVMTAGEHQVSRELFYRYSMTRDVDIEFPGARGFGFIRRVPLAEQQQFVVKAKADGWPDFRIRELTPSSGERYVIQYIEPIERNIEAVGLDIASEQNRYQAAYSSMQSGEVRLTGPITLVQASGQLKQAFLIMMPLYRGAKTPDSVAERMRLAFGWSYAPLIMSEVLADQDLNSSLVLLTLSDVTTPKKVTPFFSNFDSEKVSLNPIEQQHSTFGRTWQFSYAVTPLFVANLHLPSPVVFSVVGSAISLLLALFVGSIRINQRNKQQLVEQHSKLAAIVGSSADGIISTTLDGVVTSWNSGAENIFGYPSSETIGKPLQELIVPPTLWAEESNIFKRLAQGEHLPNFEALRHMKDDSLVNVSITFSPIHSVDGKTIGVSKTVRDISTQKAAEAKIHQLNTNLEALVKQRTTDLAKLNLLFENVLSAASKFAIIATDRQGKIQLFNHGAEHLLGYSADDVIAKSTPLIFHVSEELARRAEALYQEYQTKVDGFQVLVYKSAKVGADSDEWHYLHKNGQRVPVTLVVTTMRNDQAEVVGYLCIATDITQQKQQRTALLSTQDQLLTMTEQLTLALQVAELGVWEWALGDNSLQWDDKMYWLYEQPIALRKQGLDYSHWESRIHPDDRASTAAKLQDAVAGIGTYQSTFRLILPSGKTRYVQAAAYVQRDDAGRATKVIGINRDITTEHELELSLREAKTAADAANAAKSMFLANMSHEIRTPMNAVLGMLQLIKTTELSSQQHEYTNKAQIASKSLLNLINDILDYSKIEAGRLELERQPFKVDDLMRRLAVVLTPNLGKKAFELLFDIDPAIPDLIHGDRFRLQQILVNLASNAIKFTTDGEVVIRLQQLTSQHKTSHIRFSVTDSGIGISQEQQQRIFDGFTQAETSTARQYGGSGLGLAICKSVIQLMGGELQLRSEPGQGSCFSFDLAFAIEDTPALGDASDYVFDSNTNVLIVDDNAMALEILSKSVEQLGVTVFQARSGAEALAQFQHCMAQHLKIHVVLMDYRMPHMNGLETARQLKQITSAAEMPSIFMLTAFGYEDLIKAQTSEPPPFDAVFTKPVTPKQIDALLRRAIAGDKFVLSAKVSPRQSTRPLQGLHLLLVEDNEFNRLVATELLQNEGATVDIAVGGLEGINAVCTVKTRYDLVLMDVQMPNVDGLEATRRIRADPRFADLPIIAMTANVYASDQEACINAGMNAHLGKPFDLDKVIETILLYTSISGDKTKIHSKTTTNINPKTDSGAIAAHDTAIELSRTVDTQGNNLVVAPEQKTLESLLQRFAGDEQFYLRILNSFKTDLEQQLQNMHQAILQGDCLELLAIIHTLKGTSSTIGLSSFYQMIYDLEMQFKQIPADAVDIFEWLPAKLVQNIRLAAQAELSIIHQLLPVQLKAKTVEIAFYSSQELVPILAELKQHLTDGNLKALKITRQLKDRLVGHSLLEQELTMLAEAVERLDYATALVTLTTLTDKI